MHEGHNTVSYSHLPVVELRVVLNSVAQVHSGQLSQL
jgi:hypothetical protein